jgi:hypothetical protein
MNHARLYIEITEGCVSGVYKESAKRIIGKAPEVVICDWDAYKEQGDERAERACKKLEQLKPHLKLLEEVIL